MLLVPGHSREDGWRVQDMQWVIGLTTPGVTSTLAVVSRNHSAPGGI